MLYSDFVRIKRVRKMLEQLAYGSLILDVSISVVTLASIGLYKNQLSNIQLLLNYALSGEVIVTVALFVIFIFLSHYEKVIGNVANLHFKLRRSMSLKYGHKRRYK